MGFRYRLLKEGFGGREGGLCGEGFLVSVCFPFSDGGVGMDEKKKDVFLFYFIFNP